MAGTLFLAGDKQRYRQDQKRSSPSAIVIKHQHNATREETHHHAPPAPRPAATKGAMKITARSSPAVATATLLPNARRARRRTNPSNTEPAPRAHGQKCDANLVFFVGAASEILPTPALQSVLYSCAGNRGPSISFP